MCEYIKLWLFELWLSSSHKCSHKCTCVKYQFEVELYVKSIMSNIKLSQTSIMSNQNQSLVLILFQSILLVCLYEHTNAWVHPYVFECVRHSLPVFYCPEASSSLWRSAASSVPYTLSFGVTCTAVEEDTATVTFNQLSCSSLSNLGYCLLHPVTWQTSSAQLHSNLCIST